MNCNQVLSLIQELPIGEWRPGQRTGVERHLPGCGNCQRAFAAAMAMESELSGLPEVDAPVGFASDVAFRVANYRSTQEVLVNGNRRKSSNRLAWGAIWLGGAAGIATTLYGLLRETSLPKLVALQNSNGFERFFDMLQAGPIVYFLAASLIVYLSGIFVLDETEI